MTEGDQWAELAQLLERTELPRSARLLAVVIAVRERAGQELATVAQLGEAIGVERRQAFRLLAELEAAEVITVARQRRGLEPGPSAYRLASAVSVTERDANRPERDGERDAESTTSVTERDA